MPILLILFLLLGGFYENSQAIELPDIGISANAVMSLAEEDQLGKAFIRQLRRRVEIVDDLEINNYINQLGQSLVSYSDSPAQPFHFLVIKEPTINAFAVPGGFIGVHSGLILATHSEGELASVLAHEICPCHPTSYCSNSRNFATFFFCQHRRFSRRGGGWCL
jgi:predicted Zn-dependent protease